MNNGSRHAILWLTHVWDPDIEAEFERLRTSSARGGTEVWLLLDARTPEKTALVKRYPGCHVFEQEALFRRPFPRLGGHGLLNNPHFPLLDFFLAHPHYETYWLIEYDVRYTGKWGDLFDTFSPHDHDLLTCHVRRFRDEPSWPWWDSLRHPTMTIPYEERLRSFNVAYRMSKRALAYVCAMQESGWRGHPEVLLATLLFRGGFRLLDMGGDGEFVLPEHKNRFYTSSGSRTGYLSVLGTLRYRPSRGRPGRRKNKLYHPIKPASLRDSLSSRIGFIVRWGLEPIYF